MSDYKAAALSYLRQVLSETGLSANALAGRVEVSHTTLTRPLNNPAYKHAIKFETLQKVAQVTGIPLPRELTAADERSPTVQAVRALVVRGVVAAGMWQSVDPAQDESLGVVPMMADDRYEHFPQWAELVRGPSMNRSYQDGDYVHVVDAIELGYRGIVGDDVIVERRDEQGGKVERTCKRIARIAGKLVLVGDSTQEEWNLPLPLETGEGGTVEIVGLVIGSYRPRRR